MGEGGKETTTRPRNRELLLMRAQQCDEMMPAVLEQSDEVVMSARCARAITRDATHRRAIAREPTAVTPSRSASKKSQKSSNIILSRAHESFRESPKIC